jgi:hypothetical protein
MAIALLLSIIKCPGGHFFMGGQLHYFNPWRPEKKNPDLKVGGPNQKPLTIKPYPMKIRS